MLLVHPFAGWNISRRQLILVDLSIGHHRSGSRRILAAAEQTKRRKRRDTTAYLLVTNSSTRFRSFYSNQRTRRQYAASHERVLKVTYSAALLALDDHRRRRNRATGQRSEGFDEWKRSLLKSRTHEKVNSGATALANAVRRDAHLVEVLCDISRILFPGSHSGAIDYE
jgi:ribonucleotide monophosphatase NagD (HAD superfamily)